MSTTAEAQSAICGRTGCSRAVATGIQCEKCAYWFHPRCSGLTTKQYAAMDNKGAEYCCASCANQPHASTPVISRDASTDTSNLMGEPADSEVMVINKRLERMEAELKGLLTKTRAHLDTKLDWTLGELAHIKAVLPQSTAAEAAVGMATLDVMDASKALLEQMQREKRLIIWGNFPENVDAKSTALAVVSTVLQNLPASSVTAQKLRKKGSQASKGLIVSLPTADMVRSVLAARDTLKGAFSNVHQVSYDRPLSERQNKPKLTKVPKLLLSPKVIVTRLSSSIKGSRKLESWATVASSASCTESMQHKVVAEAGPGSHPTVSPTARGESSPRTGTPVAPENLKATLHEFRSGKTGLLGDPVSPLTNVTRTAPKVVPEQKQRPKQPIRSRLAAENGTMNSPKPPRSPTLRKEPTQRQSPPMAPFRNRRNRKRPPESERPNPNYSTSTGQGRALAALPIIPQDTWKHKGFSRKPFTKQRPLLPRRQISHGTNHLLHPSYRPYPTLSPKLPLLPYRLPNLL